MPNEPGPADTPFAQRLHALLSERGWTQERLAYESGITLGTISRLYRGITKEPRGPTRAGLVGASESPSGSSTARLSRR